MKLSTKGHCAITAMLQMALPGNRSPISLLNLSKCQFVSLSYLEQILAQLRQQGLVKGLRGPGGGYMLAKSPSEITVSTVVDAVGEVDAGRWNAQKLPEAYEAFIEVNDEARDHWNELSSQLFDVLSNVTLQDLISQRAAKDEEWHRKSQVGDMNNVNAA